MKKTKSKKKEIVIEPESEGESPFGMLETVMRVDTEKYLKYSAFSDLFLIHNALPEIDYNKIDTKTTFLNKKIDFPIVITPITGGEKKLINFNKIIGDIGNELNIPIFSGDQIHAIRSVGLTDSDKIIESYRVLRDTAPKSPVIANLKASDLINKKITTREVQKCIDMINADAISFYLSPLVDVITAGSKIGYAGLMKKIETIKNDISVPIIVKEYTAGLSHDVVRRLWDIGVDMFDVSGLGGTNMCNLIFRKNFSASAKQIPRDHITPYDNWGIPQIWSLLDIKLRKENEEIPIILSGGVRTGDQIVKGLICGADHCGISSPIVSEIYEDTRYPSEKNLESYLKKLTGEIKITMFLLGYKNISELKEHGKNRLAIFGKTQEWLNQRNLKLFPQ